MLAASAIYAVPVGAQDAQISVAVGTDVRTLSPHRATTFGELEVARALHRGLVVYDAFGHHVPGLAQEWTISSNGRVYTFTLKPNLTWSDGRPLTASDVVAGLRFALDPSRPAPFAAKLFSIANAEAVRFSAPGENADLGVQAVDERTVRITLERQAHDFLDTLAHPVAMPIPAGSAAMIEDGRVTSGAFVAGGNHTANRFRLTSVESGLSLTIQTVPSVQAAWDRFDAASAAVSAALPAVTVPAVGDRAHALRSDLGSSLYAYGVNMTRSPFNTIEVRHALAMAVKRNALLDGLVPDVGIAADQYVPRAIMGELGSYKAPYAPLTFEEREAVAAALLAEQGFDRDNPLSVTLHIPEGDIHRTVAERVTEMWALAGIGSTIVEMPMPDHWRALEDGDFDVAFMAWPGRHDTPQGFLEPLSQAGGSWNFPRYGFLDFTDRLNRALREPELEDRLKYYREAEKAIIEDQTLMALFFYRSLSLVSPNVLGWQSNTTGMHPLSTLAVQAPARGLDLIRSPLPQSVPSYGEDP